MFDVSGRSVIIDKNLPCNKDIWFKFEIDKNGGTSCGNTFYEFKINQAGFISSLLTKEKYLTNIKELALFGNMPCCRQNIGKNK